MMQSIEIAGFKRFETEPFKLRPLTVLTGLNGSGKTSVLHAMLIMHEALHGVGNGVVRLNGPFELELGTAEDVINWSGQEKIAFKISDENGTYSWDLHATANDAMHLIADEVPSTVPSAFGFESNSFEYLSAERLGPRDSFPASPLPAAGLGIGVRGEHCAQILEAHGNKPAFEDRLHPESSAPSLLKYEVERWLSEIARPIEIDAVRYSGSTIYALKFRAPGETWVRATNMGFGVSYALPVILAGLTAKRGGLIIVENPEAHLHPAGQSRMGIFLAWLASKGVQVLIETHSDHVLNGIRRAIGEYKYLPASEAVVHFFDSGEMASVEELHFTPIGGISHWPTGFFDQYQIDTAALGRVRRGAV
ncbi:AAA family ATPase [Duganella sp. CT11-25]|jgi:predicted ATPase|uniref:AAA family ATPase n=1 Tax=unclassified Duganella TaxID=2636909 RepID=UPI0039B0F4DB